MAWGIEEFILPAVILLAIAIFGRSIFMKMYRDFKGIKTDMMAVDEEIKAKEKLATVKAKA